MTRRGGHDTPAPARVALFVVAVAALVLTASAYRRDFLADDAFITFRYARNLLEGHGLVFNVGERVEGFSSPLHVLAVAGLGALGCDLVQAGRGLGLAAAILLIPVAALAAGRGGGGSLVSWRGAFAAALTAASPHLAVWSLGGLETTLYALLSVGAIVPLLLGSSDRRSFLVSSAIAGAATLARPEGLVPYLAIAAWFALASRGSARERTETIVRGAALYTAIVGVWVVARLVYYGSFLPNTYHAKGAFTWRHVARGLDYLGHFAIHPWVPPAVVLTVVAVRLAAPGARLVAAVLAAQMATVVVVGGDGLPAYRFVVPSIAPLAVLTALGAGAVWERLPGRGTVLRAGIVAACAALVAAAAWARDDAQWRLYDFQKRYEVPTWTLVGEWLHDNVPRDASIAAVPIGAVGYYSGLTTIDLLGLTDRHISRVPTPGLGGGWAGHEKTDGAYVLSREPDMLLLGNIYVGPYDLARSDEFPPYTNAAIYARERDIVTDARFARDYVKTSVPIAEGRYLNMFARREFIRRVAPGADVPRAPDRRGGEVEPR